MNLSQATDEACHAYTAHGFTGISRRHQILVTIWVLEAEVNNGGFDQYYGNSSGALAWCAPEALREIGAVRMASIVERANAHFGPDGPPVDRSERWDALEAIRSESGENWDDAYTREFQDYPENISELLVARYQLDRRR